MTVFPDGNADHVAGAMEALGLGSPSVLPNHDGGQCCGCFDARTAAEYLGERWCNHPIGLIVLLTMTTMLILTNLVGLVLPSALTRLRLDPAIASGPLISSVADAVGLILYFSVVVWILGPTVT